MDQPRITGEESMAAGRFLTLKTLHWRDAKGVDRKWETAERLKFHGAVIILARLMPSRRVLLIRQFRPPVGQYIIELPAGLIDEGETPESAGLRELHEETGYTGIIVASYPPMYPTPGMTNEYASLVVAEIDEKAPENQRPQTHFDASEMIESVFVPQEYLAEFYRAECAKGTLFDAKLASFIVGLAGL